MKKSLIGSVVVLASLVVISSAPPSFAQHRQLSNSLTGVYYEKTEHPDFDAITKEECKQERGRWVQSDEYGANPVCLVSNTNTVRVTRRGGQLKLAIKTHGNDTNTCEFSAIAQVSMSNPNEFTATDDRGCVVHAVFSENHRTVFIGAEYDKCKDNCGDGAYLDVELAIKRKR